MSRIIVRESDGPAIIVEVTQDQEDGTGMWDCETCGDGAMRPNLIEAIMDAQVHVDVQCPKRG